MVIDMPVRGCQFHGGEKDEQGFLVFCGKPVAPEYSYCPTMSGASISARTCPTGQGASRSGG